MIQTERLRALNDKAPRKGRYVLYWMQASQRAEYNHALEYAVERANGENLPVVVLFGLTDDFPEANLRHYSFMLEGLREVQDALEQRGIRFVLRRESPEKAAAEMAAGAALVVADRGYLRIQRAWREHVAKAAPCAVVEVESDVVVPVEAASGKEEYAAATIRPKIRRLLNAYLLPLKERRVEKDATALTLGGIRIETPRKLAADLGVDPGVPPVGAVTGGLSGAKALLEGFLGEKLRHYRERRGDPSLDYASGLSPYLHFGQISPLFVALKVLGRKGVPEEDRQAFLEELIVRRELAVNFVRFNPRYDAFDAAPEWARRTLAEHRRDRREYVYSLDDLERAKTHDPYWNAAQREMVLTGRMHNYMRMYWGKKIIEWSESPEEAFRAALFLNNRYELDGRDPNGFAGVAWCFGKHDRPWQERKVFGKVRYMNAAGLERKFNIGAYVEKVSALAPSALA